MLHDAEQIYMLLIKRELDINMMDHMKYQLCNNSIEMFLVYTVLYSSIKINWN